MNDRDFVTLMGFGSTLKHQDSIRNSCLFKDIISALIIAGLFLLLSIGG